MVNVGERQFHLLMGALLFGSVLLDQVLRNTPAWHMPQVTLLSLVIGLIWVALFAGHRLRGMHERLRVFEDRLERAERKAAALEDELRLRDGKLR